MIRAKIQSDLERLKSPAKARLLSGFFKTGPGQYGEGDVFLGITVPQQREVVKRHWKEASLEDIDALLKSKIHEHRLTALLMLVEKYKQAAKEKDGVGQKRIFDFYLSHAKGVNNWDLVDASAPYIVGGHLQDKDWDILLRLAKSKNIWERRIAMVATLSFIRNGQYGQTQKIAQMLLDDSHDLIHKASGWMLREMGKRGGERELRAFLDRHAKQMPRTMLRYSIERMDDRSRKRYLQA